MQIVDPVTGEVCPVGVEGELVMKGPQIMKGYLNNVAATKECMHDGWFASGKSFKWTHAAHGIDIRCFIYTILVLNVSQNSTVQPYPKMIIS